MKLYDKSAYFSANGGTYDYDIAILELDRAINYGSDVGRAYLLQPGWLWYLLEMDKCFISGYGRTTTSKLYVTQRRKVFS